MSALRISLTETWSCSSKYPVSFNKANGDLSSLCIRRGMVTISVAIFIVALSVYGFNGNGTPLAAVDGSPTILVIPQPS